MWPRSVRIVYIVTKVLGKFISVKIDTDLRIPKIKQ